MTKKARFGLSLDRPSSKIISVDYKTADITAKAGIDYVYTSGTISFNPGLMSTNVDVELIDSKPQNDITFTLDLSNPINATLSSITTGKATIPKDVTPIILPVITISSGSIEEITPQESNISPSTNKINYDNTVINTSSQYQILTLSNSGNKDATITDILLPSGFTISSDSPSKNSIIAVNNSVNFKICFSPSSLGLISDNLIISTDGPVSNNTFKVLLTGTCVENSLDKLSISGNQIIKTKDNSNFRLRSCNWFGAEGSNFTPHGTWVRRWSDILDQIKSMGFNCLRIPFSGTLASTNPIPPTTAIDFTQNKEFSNKTSLEIFDIIFDYCNKIGLYVVLDHHLRVADSNAGGSDGSPISSTYTEQDWINDWLVMANRYSSYPAVIGADLHNEPYQLKWSEWATHAENCANEILKVSPDWLFFVEGVGSSDDGTDSTWWGGYLKGVKDRPVSLSVKNKVIYSPHEYGQSVQVQSWLASDTGSTPDNWPKNLYSRWSDYWGFIFENNIAPIFIGEFGGKLGVNGTGGTEGVTNSVSEKTWFNNLISYIDGDFDDDGVSNLVNEMGMSFSYWCINPNSSDTGGLLQDDWITPQTVKLNLLKPALES